MGFLIRIIAVCALLAGLLWYEIFYDNDIFLDKPTARIVYRSDFNDNEEIIGDE